MSLFYLDRTISRISLLIRLREVFLNGSLTANDLNNKHCCEMVVTSARFKCREGLLRSPRTPLMTKNEFRTSVPTIWSIVWGAKVYSFFNNIKAQLRNLQVKITTWSFRISSEDYSSVKNRICEVGFSARAPNLVLKQFNVWFLVS